MKREHVKLLIESAPSVEKADELIDAVYQFESFAEKIAFLKGMFGIKLVSKTDAPSTSKEKSDEMTYWVMLESIINS